MTLFWTKTWDALAGALFPTPCVTCGALISAHDPPLCPECWNRLPLIQGFVCRCGASVPGSQDQDCGRCRRGLSVISEGVALGVYDGALRDCVVALKYHGRYRTAERLASRLAANVRCRRFLDAADVVVGVPLHADRVRHRGFNQADLLARALGKESGAVVSCGLIRTKDTRTQTALSARDRRRNVRGAFAVRTPGSFRGATVILVDDVTTTGATLRECALTLLGDGASEVRSITAARAE